MCSTIQRLDCEGVIFQPDEQVDTNSMMEVPFPDMEFSNPLHKALPAFLTAAAVCTL